ncbi:hypothetical protein SAMN03159343_2407 [Klenkia marina]|uniref:Tryptophan-associated transmembrane protein (Trp_oprn_chp) n=1 Tax=Klenkia marina TaxID=1960309 RepID=A0A1G4YAF2_9ACTN|nr:hypothetical protein [Klenkia marina]SCX50431.1 hypothetical protein SAMN03159343_2407 [Klenkia marina]
MTQPVPVRRLPPIPAGIAALCGLLGALPVAVFSFIAGVFALAGQVWVGVLLSAVPAAVAVVIAVGAVLLLMGRSWVVLVVGAVLTLGLVVWAVAYGAADDDPVSLAVLVGGPLLAAVLGSLPSVRAWVAARRAERGARV